MLVISKKLKKARELLNYTQAEMAVKSGIQQRDVSQLENGRKEFIPNRYIRFMNLSGIDLNTIFDDTADVLFRTTTRISSESMKRREFDTAHPLADEEGKYITTEESKKNEEYIKLMADKVELLEELIQTKNEVIKEMDKRLQLVEKIISVYDGKSAESGK